MTNTFRKVYRELTKAELELVGKIKSTAEELEGLYNSIDTTSNFAKLVDVEQAQTRLQESVMWATKAATT